jgi:predicted transcriptional regulator
MVRRPAVHRPTATVAELRAFFDDDHMHMSLIVDNGILVGVIERGDLITQTTDVVSAREIARLDGCTIRPDASLREARARMTHEGRRRLAVTTQESALVGLLCLKASGRGFCSDEDVAARRQSASDEHHGPPDQSASGSSMTTRAR